MTDLAKFIVAVVGWYLIVVVAWSLVLVVGAMVVAALLGVRAYVTRIARGSV